MDNLTYFVSLVNDNEALTSGLTDDLASPLRRFAEACAARIAVSALNIEEKERLFRLCMSLIQIFARAVAGILSL